MLGVLALPHSCSSVISHVLPLHTSRSLTCVTHTHTLTRMGCPNSSVCCLQHSHKISDTPIKHTRRQARLAGRRLTAVHASSLQPLLLSSRVSWRRHTLAATTATATAGQHLLSAAIPCEVSLPSAAPLPAGDDGALSLFLPKSIWRGLQRVRHEEVGLFGGGCCA